MAIHDYNNAVRSVIDRIEETQQPNIEKAARLLADAIRCNKRIFSFGCAHSSILTEEIFYRAGGCMLINPIFVPSLLLTDRPVTMTTYMERMEGFAEIILSGIPLSEGDVLILISTSGRNAVPIEMALEAKRRGAKVVAVTSLTYSGAVESRHSSGKKVSEVADIILDSGVAVGDAAVSIEGLQRKMGPTSTIAGAVLLHTTINEAVGLLVQEGIEPPIFASANIDPGAALKEKLLRQYKEKVLLL